MTVDFEDIAAGAWEKEARFCKNCKHVTTYEAAQNPSDKIQCGHLLLRDPSGTQTVHVSHARKEGQECGPEGLLFEAREE